VGAVAAEVLLYTGNPILAGAAAGGVTTLVGMSLEKATGKSDASWGEIFAHTAIDAGVGAALCGLSKSLGGIKGVKPGSTIPKISGGRGNWQAVWRAGLKKMDRYGYSMSKKVMLKGGASLFADGLMMDAWYGYKMYTIGVFE